MAPWFGPWRGTLDIKRRGVFPMTQAMRVHALALGLEETGTLDRLAGATARGAFTAGEAAELKEAYATVVRVRLGHQLAAVEAGAPADDLVRLGRLGRIDRLVLGEAFKTLAWLQRALEEHFHTAYL
jgi:CBS domain-containing protein